MRAPLMRASSLLFTTTVLIFSSSCLGPKRINKWVKQEYGETAADPVKKKSDYLTISFAMPSMGNAVSEGTKQTHNMLPLLFYWRFDYDNTCSLNPQIPINNFINTVTPYANKSLRKKLDGKRIELSVDKIPTRFMIADHAQVIWFVYAYGWDKISIEPLDDRLVVTYKIINPDNSQGMTGTVTALNTDRGVALGQFQSLKRRTKEYLSDYNQSITNMSRNVIDQIVNELE